MNRIYQKTRKKLLQYTQPEPMLAVGSLSLSLVSIRFTLPPLFIVNHFVSLFLCFLLQGYVMMKRFYIAKKRNTNALLYIA